jgi:tetratricopeptide (TPR) repeat protein
MQSGTCSACENSFNKNDTFEVLGRTLCGPCGEEFINGLQSNTLGQNDVVRNVDPTVCAWCSTDLGDTPLPTSIANLPTCEPCDTRMRNWPYPLWVKASFVALLLTAVVAFAWNWRFLDALITLRTASKSLQAGEFSKTADLYEHAAASVPEVKELGDQAAFYRGLALVYEDRPKEALPLLERAAKTVPNDSRLQQMIVHTRCSVAFDDKDYNTMISEARAYKRLAPGEARSHIVLASALACRYATKGDRDDYDAAIQELEEGKKIAGADPEFAVDEDRVLHRLETREIIKRKEFQARFPNGWHGGNNNNKAP